MGRIGSLWPHVIKIQDGSRVAFQQDIDLLDRLLDRQLHLTKCGRLVRDAGSSGGSKVVAGLLPVTVGASCTAATAVEGRKPGHTWASTSAPFCATLLNLFSMVCAAALLPAKDASPCAVMLS